VGADCEIRGYFEDVLDFRLLRSSDVRANRNSPNAGAEGASPTEVSPNTPDDAQRSSGTGFFVTSNGHIVTNNHVIEGCQRITTVAGPSHAIARVIAKDKTNDLAILKTELNLAAVPSLRKTARLGETIYVYGFPLSGLLSTSGNFAVGSITALIGLADDSRLYQISAPVQLGNSGGPVIDKAGNVVGIIVGKLNALGVASVTHDVPQNINFAIKSSILDNFLNSNEIVANGAEKSGELQAEEIAIYAKSFTVQVVCN
jgi:S1-C subfamily serine protease